MTKTVIILGAGATRALGAKAAMKNRPPLDSDFFEISRLGKFAEYDDVVKSLQELVGDYSNSLSKSLERSATHLYLKAIDSAPGSIYYKGFLRFLELLNRVLGHTTNQLKTGPRSLLYRFILNELKLVNKPEELAVITFNYDLVVERVLDEIALKHGSDIFQFPNCYRLPKFESTNAISKLPQFENHSQPFQGVPIFKLHGSLNWLSRHNSPMPSPKSLFSPKREIHIADSPFISTNLSWTRNKKRVYLKPIIVPPVSGKRGMMHETFDSLWLQACSALQSADRIVIAGYSCPPLDIEAHMLLSENLRQNPDKKLYVIDPNAECAAKFIDICGVNHSTIYKSIESWVNDGKNITAPSSSCLSRRPTR